MRPFSRCRIARRRIYGSATSCISIAVITRVGTPCFSSASCNASALITVASIPIWSAATRSVFCAAAATPRKKFPPPTTRPICTPLRATSATSDARAATRDASTPKDPSPASTSPLILRRMRPYFATVWLFRGCSFSRSRVADLESHKARDRNILAQLRNLRLDHLSDGRRIFLDEWLLVQADLFKVFVHAPFDDLVRHLLGLALVDRAGALDLALLGKRRLGHIFAADKLRIGRRHLHCQILHQLLKIAGARDEIGLAVHLDQHAQLRPRMNVTSDHALPGRTRSLLARRRDSLL